MYVCVCTGITDKDIRDAARAGVRDLNQLSATTGCTTVCGSCGDLAMEILQETQREALALPVLAAA